MRCIDVIQKMLQHLAVLQIEQTKQFVRDKGGDDDTQRRQQKQIYLLEQAGNVAHWIGKFDPQNVNVTQCRLP